ncbi:OmpA family protein [Psychrobacter arenosus]|uniref:OmpA/MotB family protein n=1 Tax=Psychrobacter arenosus TaxID=256326 RepID=UPI001918AF27|nr:OmpA family protein [Psychrobacter arenosus]
MQKKPSEWISIADLMSGVMAVVMLLLVISVLQNTYAEVKHKQEMESSQKNENQKIESLLEDIQSSVTAQGAGNLIDFNLEQSKITLKDNIFARGSACITPEAQMAFKNIEDKINRFLQQSSSAKIFVEGHTDNIPVSKPVTDYQRFCTVYDDNYTLSAARAREARKLLVGQLDSSIAKRIIVAGYGDSQPIKGISPEDDANRRVEVRLSLK